ncbi:tannase/feruloyl esterase family alpha/beta hydrolase [Variovorax sp. J22R24]|uniref:tannase/feruloyl esterase family alpha/beta hydrolase n=1 Tax=Variovorax gracilis TaxID=3053502 RepID=UPI002578B3D2|nr:tannase/feruloyl esterase family alpha/beta hydrolase [Variovorax sp. J22R24]MDM0104847.1 tannase/feruloyl esterase family alpha/beta hydrolase [Variovorax sp. J22R24]
MRWVGGSTAPAVPPDAATNATQWLYGSNWIRYAIARDAAFDVRNYEPAAFQARVQQTSELIDASDPNLAPFFARGGKLIMRENAGDRAQSALMGIAYHQAVVARLGVSTAEGAMRLYVSPASTHSGNARSVLDQQPVPTMVDLLDPLDRWVTSGQPPPDVLVQTDRAAAPPFAVRAGRPLCRHPAYPRYIGGDRLRVDSYACTAAQP